MKFFFLFFQFFFLNFCFFFNFFVRTITSFLFCYEILIFFLIFSFIRLHRFYFVTIFFYSFIRSQRLYFDNFLFSLIIFSQLLLFNQIFRSFFFSILCFVHRNFNFQFEILFFNIVITIKKWCYCLLYFIC